MSSNATKTTASKENDEVTPPVLSGSSAFGGNGPSFGEKNEDQNTFGGDGGGFRVTTPALSSGSGDNSPATGNVSFGNEGTGSSSGFGGNGGGFGAAASVALDGIDTAATITDAIKGELTETKQTITNTESIEEKNIEEKTEVIDTYSGVFKLPPTTKKLLGSAISTLEEVAIYAPGAKLVLNLCAGIYERFQAERELSENITAALDIVAEVARHIAKGGKTLENVNWTNIETSLKDIEELISKISNRSKLSAWWNAKLDVEELEATILSLRTAMNDAQFEMNIELAVKVDQVSEQLRSEVGDLKNLLNDEFMELRGRLAKHLNVNEEDMKKEINVVLEEIHTDVKNIKSNQEKQLENQEKILAKLAALHNHKETKAESHRDM